MTTIAIEEDYHIHQKLEEIFSIITEKRNKYIRIICR